MPASQPANVETTPISSAEKTGGSETVADKDAFIVSTLDIEDIQNAVKAWASAWSSKDIDKYLASYANDFQPSQTQTREAWQQTRRQRILKPEPILVEVSDIEISTLDETYKNVHFKQLYQSGKISERNSKNLVMKKSDGTWLIVKETSGPI